MTGGFRGITPAYAGKSTRWAASRQPSGDHPRVCGEKRENGRFLGIPEGSPPRMRGKVLPPPLAALHRGITPAYAGKRRLPYRRCRSRQDHPRICGEKHRGPVLVPLLQGSPPRMRGKVIAAAEGARTRRITPVYAGKRGRCPRPVGRRWDHPRVCGEKTVL